MTQQIYSSSAGDTGKVNMRQYRVKYMRGINT